MNLGDMKTFFRPLRNPKIAGTILLVSITLSIILTYLDVTIVRHHLHLDFLNEQKIHQTAP